MPMMEVSLSVHLRRSPLAHAVRHKGLLLGQVPYHKYVMHRLQLCIALGALGGDGADMAVGVALVVQYAFGLYLSVS